MSAFARLCDRMDKAKLRPLLVRTGSESLELRAYDPDKKKTLAKTAFNPDAPDAAAYDIAQKLLLPEEEL